MRRLMVICVWGVFSAKAIQKTVVVTPVIVTAKRAGNTTLFNQQILTPQVETTSVGDALRFNTTKVALTRYGGAGQLESISFRGLPSGHSTILLDEVVLPQTGVSSFNMTHLQIGTIDTVTINTGADEFLNPVSSNAGVLSLGIAPPKKSSHAVTLAQSNTGDSEAQVSIGRVEPRYRWQQSFSGLYTEGMKRKAPQRQWGEENRYKNGGWAGFFERDLDEQFSVNILARVIYNTLRTDLDGVVPNTKPHDQINTALYLGRLQFLYSPPTKPVEHLLQLSYIMLDNTYKKSASESQRVGQYAGLYRYENKVIAHNTFRLVTRMSYANQAFTQKNTQASQVIGVTDTYQLTGNMGIGGGARLDHMRPYGTYPSYSAWIDYKLQEDHLLSLQYKTAVRFPTLYERYGGLNLTGNQQLKPERGWTAQIGLHQTLMNKAITLQNALFYTKITDLIYGRQLSQQQYIRENNALKAYGWETEMTWRMATAVTLQAQYTLTLFDKPATLFLLQEGARHKGLIALTWQIDEQWRAKIRGRYVGRRQSFAFKQGKTQRTWLKDYHIWQGNLSYQLTPQAYAYVRVENILNTSYQEVYGYPMPGRGIYVGCHVTF